MRCKFILKLHKVQLLSQKKTDIKRKYKFVIQPFLNKVLVLSIKNGFYKIKKLIYRPHYARYDKMLRSKILHLKPIYKFYFDHFLKKRTLIKKTWFKIKSCGFRLKNARYVRKNIKK